MNFQGLAYFQESLLSYELKGENFDLCYKCQENAIIVHEFKGACMKFSENFDQLQDHTKINIQEDFQHDFTILNEIQEDDQMENGFDELITYESAEELLGNLDKDVSINDQHNENELSEESLENDNFNPENMNVETLEEFILEEEVIAEEIGKRFRCNICNKFYANRDSLTRHKIRHQTSPKLKCSYCPRVFYFSRELNFHLKQHLLPQPDYKCEICDKYYGTSSSLKKHLDLHTKAKEFKCTYEGCNLGFIRKYTLQNHMLTHSNVRPFKCMICEASFNQKNILLRHMKSCHNENYFKCEYCKNVSFEKKSELRDHYTDCDDFLNSRQ